ncbi:hypothetical protein IM043_gp218 [Bacillus phage SPG24]|nr:hypothetical protein IM043_gp218 [Bacillus phage SPG24]
MNRDDFKIGIHSLLVIPKYRIWEVI